MARVEAYPHAEFHLDPSNRLATIHRVMVLHGKYRIYSTCTLQHYTIYAYLEPVGLQVSPVLSV